MLFQLLHLPFWNVGSLSHMLPEPSTANTISSLALAQVGGGVGGGGVRGGGVDGLGVTQACPMRLSRISSNWLKSGEVK